MCKLSLPSWSRACGSHATTLSQWAHLANARTHSVKTRIQLDPATYNRGFIGGFKQVIQNEGAGASTLR